MRKLLENILTIGTIASFLAMVMVVLLQVMTRYLLPFSFHWTEELARFLFLYTVACAAGLAVRDHAFVNVDLVPISLRGRSLYILQLFLEIVTLVFLIVLFVHSLRFVELGGRQTSASLRVRMSWIFLVTSIIPASMGIFTVMEIVRIIRTGEAEPVVSDRTVGEHAEIDDQAAAEIHEILKHDGNPGGDQ